MRDEKEILRYCTGGKDVFLVLHYVPLNMKTDGRVCLVRRLVRDPRTQGRRTLGVGEDLGRVS